VIKGSTRIVDPGPSYRTWRLWRLWHWQHEYDVI